MTTKSAPTVQSQSGTLQGTWEDDNQIAVFKGIPYAQPPVGSLRWSPPQPVEPWTGTQDATKFSPTSWQRLVDFAVFGQKLVDGQGWNIARRSLIKMLLKMVPAPNQNEDCLYLNIRTPSLENDAKLPVMVWIHGGDHQDGSGAEPFYVSNALAHQEVVYVSINYRLGLMGYFAHAELTAESELGVSGNYGTLDQIAALKWVQENITNFGGDPDNVTIFGESAGGESVAHMMTSPLATGLFHKAIMQSPANAGQMMHLFDEFMDYPSGEDLGKMFAETLDISGVGTVEKLRQISAADLYTHLREESRLGNFYPLIDGYVLPQSPFSAFHEGKQANVPFIVGSNADEGTLIHPMMRSPLVEYRYREIADDQLPSFVYDDFPEEIERLLQLYPGLAKRESQAEADFLGDGMFGAKTRFYAGQAANTGQPTYFYLFNRVPPSQKQTVGAFHGADLSFVFGTSTPILPLSEGDKALSETMVQYWTQFAKSGDPNCAGQPDWRSFADDDPQWMVFTSENSRTETVAREEQYQLFNQRTLRQIAAMGCNVAGLQSGRVAESDH